MWYVQSRGLHCSSCTSESSTLAVSLASVSSWLSPSLRVCVCVRGRRWGGGVCVWRGQGEGGRVADLHTKAECMPMVTQRHSPLVSLGRAQLVNKSSDTSFGRSTACWSSSLLLEEIWQKFRGVTWVQKTMLRLIPEVAKSNMKQFSSFFPFPFCTIFGLLIFLACWRSGLLLYLSAPFAIFFQGNHLFPKAPCLSHLPAAFPFISSFPISNYDLPLKLWLYDVETHL